MSVSKWFKPVSIYDLAFLFHRLTGVVLLIYLCLHLAYLSTLSDPQLYEYMTSITLSPQFMPLDTLLILCGVYHGINGIRVVIHELGYLHEHRKVILAFTFVATIVVWIIATYMMLEVL